MGILTDLFNRSVAKSEMSIKMNAREDDSSLVTGGSNGSSVINEDTALRVAALNQGISIIADTIASMPIYLHKEVDGFQQTFKNDYRSRALSGMANQTLTSFHLKRNIVKDLILHGIAFAKIERISDEQVELHYFPKDTINIKKDNNGYYIEIKGHSTDITGERFEAEVLDFYDTLVFLRNPKYNSLSGTGILDYANSTLDLSINETNYMLNLFRNGLSAKSVLSTKGSFNKETKEKLKEDLQKFYSGVDNAGKILVLEGDVSVQSLALTPADIRIIESKNLSVTEIARFLNVPKHMLGLDRGSGTYSNITQERLSLYQNALTPYTVIIEEALNQKLLTEEEIEQGYYFQCDISEILKLTPEDQAKYMLDLFKENIVTVEEVRTALNLGGSESIISELKNIQTLKAQNTVNELKEENKEATLENDRADETTEAYQEE